MWAKSKNISPNVTNTYEPEPEQEPQGATFVWPLGARAGDAEKNEETEPLEKKQGPGATWKKRGAGAEKKLAGSPALAKTIQKFANEYMSDLLVLSNDLKIENVITIALCISGPLMTTNE